MEAPLSKHVESSLSGKGASARFVKPRKADHCIPGLGTGIGRCTSTFQPLMMLQTLLALAMYSAAYAIKTLELYW